MVQQQHKSIHGSSAQSGSNSKSGFEIRTHHVGGVVNEGHTSTTHIIIVYYFGLFWTLKIRTTLEVMVRMDRVGMELRYAFWADSLAEKVATTQLWVG